MVLIYPFAGTTYRILLDLVGKPSLDTSHPPKINLDVDFTAIGVNGYYIGTGNLDSFTYWSKSKNS